MVSERLFYHTISLWNERSLKNTSDGRMKASKSSAIFTGIQSAPLVPVSHYAPTYIESYSSNPVLKSVFPSGYGHSLLMESYTFHEFAVLQHSFDMEKRVFRFSSSDALKYKTHLHRCHQNADIFSLGTIRISSAKRFFELYYDNRLNRESMYPACYSYKSLSGFQQS